MSSPASAGADSAPPNETPTHQPFVPASESPPELTWVPVVTGALLGIIFGASSLYLVLKVGLTVSASIPVAVMAITLFISAAVVTVNLLIDFLYLWIDPRIRLEA